LADFPYVNGGLFSEVLPVFSFTSRMREVLVQTNEYDWSNISPAIFGSMFQTVKSKEDRRSLGEHYTSESNILKVIRPLFLDDLTERLRKAWGSAASLKKLHAELAGNNYLDPACGSGSFLVVAYKRLRAIELKLVARMQELEGKSGDVYIDGRMGLSVTLEQFHGFEINEWSSQIATVAMYLADHQANIDLEEVTGYSPNRFPIDRTAHIHNVNALQADWALLCPLSETTFIMGNPPFYGARRQDAEKKIDTMRVWGAIKGVGELDFVTNWFLIAARHAAASRCRVAFVATSSIS
jgi:type I restriction-modification system DNA methylase subunit